MKYLRHYQVSGVEGVSKEFRAGNKNVILCIATAGGKTACAMEMIRRSLINGKKCLFLSDRNLLIKQFAAEADDWSIEYGKITANGFSNRHAPFQIASKDTFASYYLRRKIAELPHFDFVSVDEVHRAGAVTWKKVLAAYPKAFKVGLTATPVRPDGHDLAPEWQALVCPVQPSQLLAEGFLVPAECYAPTFPDLTGVRRDGDGDYNKKDLERVMNRNNMVGDAFTWWKRLGQDRQTIVYGVGINHCIALRDEYLKAGVKAVHVNGTSTEEELEDAFGAFKDGKIKVLFSADLITEGADLPICSCIQIIRPSKSLRLVLQMYGRGLRIHPESQKVDCRFIDHCLDEKTEILTKRGFVERSVIKDDDMVAAMDIKDGSVSWQPILERIDREIGNGEKMFEANGPSVDIRVTGNHRIVHKRAQTVHNHWTGEWSLAEAEDLSKTRSRFRIPVSGVQKSEGLQLSDDEIRFIGWFMTDGHLNSHGTIVIAQASHQPQLVDLMQCIKGCGFDYNSVEREPSPNALSRNKHTYIFIPKGTCAARPKRGWVKLLPYIDKDFSPALEDLDERQFEILLHAIHLGDGCKDRLPGSYRIVKGNPVFADRLQSMCVRRGFRCNIHTRQVPEDQSGRNVIQRKPIFTLNIKKMSEITLHGINPVGGQTSLKESSVVSGERVWCVRNQLGTLVTRRNGKIAIVGNSGVILLHGLPNQDIPWTLDPNSGKIEAKREKARQEGALPTPVVCPKCFTMYQNLPACPACGHKAERRGRPIKNKPGTLVKVDKSVDGKPKLGVDYNRIWMQCLAIACNRRGGNFSMAAAIFRQRTNCVPWQLELNLKMFPPEDEFGKRNWSMPIADAYPGFVRKKKEGMVV